MLIVYYTARKFSALMSVNIGKEWAKMFRNNIHGFISNRLAALLR